MAVVVYSLSGRQASSVAASFRASRPKSPSELELQSTFSRTIRCNKIDMTAWFGASQDSSQETTIFAENDISSILREVSASNQKLVVLQSSDPSTLVTQTKLLNQLQAITNTRQNRLKIENAAQELDVREEDILNLIEKAQDSL